LDALQWCQGTAGQAALLEGSAGAYKWPSGWDCLQVLTLKAMGINDLLGFDFMDPPPAATLVGLLYALLLLSCH